MGRTGWLVVAIAVTSGSAALVISLRKSPSLDSQPSSRSSGSMNVHPEVVPTPSVPTASHVEGNGSESPPSPERESTDEWPLPDVLSPEERTRLKAELAGVARTSVTSLIDEVVQATRNGGRKSLRLGAMHLRWKLAQEPGGLADVERTVRTPSNGSDVIRTVIYIVGEVGSDHARDMLLRWLDDPALATYQAAVLEALWEGSFATESAIASEYRELSADRPWPKEYRPGVYPPEHPNPRLLEVTINHLAVGNPNDTREEAARILAQVLGLHFTADNVDPGTRANIQCTFLEILRNPSSDASLRETAVSYLQRIRTPELATALWQEFEKQDPQSRARAVLAAAVARQADSVMEVRRTLDIFQRDQSESTRSMGAAQLRLDGIRSSDDRKAVSQALAEWGMSERSDIVRERLVQDLTRLLPESEPFMQWALQDRSEAIRAKAQAATQQR